MKKDLSIINKQQANKAEAIACVPNEWLQLVYQEKWFKLFVPKELSGLGYTLPQVLRLEEELANKDGSLAWTVTLCAGAAWFVGFLNQNLAKEIFTDPKVCFAGSGFVGGTADFINNQYIINGSWTYASGALHATHFTANCKMLTNGIPMLDDNGNQLIKPFILLRNEVEILDGWSYMGMVATGSHAFKVSNVTLKADRCFQILPEKVTLSDVVFKYPFLQLAETTLAANVLGITLHFIALVQECFTERNKIRNYDDLHLNYYNELRCNNHQYLLNSKLEFYDAVENSWEELSSTGFIKSNTLQKVSKASRDLAVCCREAGAKLHPFAGLEAAKNHTEINRVWRDMNTVSQHALLIFPF